MNRASTARAAGTILADDNNAECPTATQSTIQGAVAAAGAGNTKIVVCAGLYLGQVQVSSVANLKLVAKPGAVLQPNFGPFNRPLMLVSNSTNVTVKGFTVEGENSLSTAASMAAIQFDKSSGSILNYTIMNWHAPTYPTDRNAVGIMVSASIM